MRFDEADHRTHQRRRCIFIVITALARISALITLIGLLFTTSMEWVAVSSWDFRTYVTIVTIIVAYLELLWIFDKCMACFIGCCRSEKCLYWICCVPIDNWIKTIIYVGLSIPFFVPKWFSSALRTDVKIAGALLLVTGVLYLIKTFKYKTSGANNGQENDSILHSSNAFFQTSISTQMSANGINNDNLSSTFEVCQERNKIP